MLEEIAELLKSVHQKLDVVSENEAQFGIDVCEHLNQLSWETYKTMNNVLEIKDIYGA